MNILVIGYGSIGKRHAHNIHKLGHVPILLRHKKTQQNLEGFAEYYRFSTAVSQCALDGAIICSPTAMHISDVKKCINHKIPFLLEKPPTPDLQTTQELLQLIHENMPVKYDIGLNLRYYPPLQFIKEYLPQLGQIYSAQISVGYYLPYWRQNIDYRKSSSAKKELGGGVHIELIHDLDYALWFFGYPEKTFGQVHKVSNLDISTDDLCSIHLNYENGSLIELHLDYLSHSYQRHCRIIAENGTMTWDMNEHTVCYTKRGETQPIALYTLPIDYDINQTYIDELTHFIHIIKDDDQPTISVNHIQEMMRIVNAIERSSQEEKSIYLKEIKYPSEE